jgi:hypothetical protein
MKARSISLWCVLLLTTAGAQAAYTPATQPGEAAIGSLMDYGPFLASSVSQDPGPMKKGKKAPERIGFAEKGLTIDVGNGATVCFDEDTCRMAAGWTGKMLDLSRTHQTSLKGSWDATPNGPLVFSTRVGPGWAMDGSFNDPRANHVGPLPKEWAHYKGLYRHGKQVVISYSVGDADILELPGSVQIGEQFAFTRTILVGKSSRPLKLDICDGDKALTEAVATTATEGKPTLTETSIGFSRPELDLPPIMQPASFKIVITVHNKTSNPKKFDKAYFEPLFKMDQAISVIEDLPAFCKGGPSLWDPPIITQGRLAPSGNKPYVVDTIALPDNNPWHSWIRFTGLDFFSDGRCAVCTFNGDVWIVSGIDDGLQHVTWKRFATGLYEPLGLKIVDGLIYVTCRDQITRLHDLDGDGEADFYENFNNDVPTWPAYHSFHFDLQTDSQGNFWYITCGNSVPSFVPMGGSVIKVSKDGSKAEVVATGLRAANGCGMGPHDEFVTGDNQGNWTPVCRINWIKPGGFYGFNNTPQLATPEDIAHERKTYDLPLCWIPYEYDNSTGGQVFVTSNKWGPLEGRMLSTSYGKCKLFEVVWEECEGVMQGATIPLPLNFDSGIMRARFSPIDGQLYVCGLKGWETSGSRDGCLQRVRYTGKQTCLPCDLHVQKDGLTITFTCPLDPKVANDEQSFGIQQYNYKWSGQYGSKKYKVSDPSQVGMEDVEVKSSKLMPDGKTVFLQIPHLRPVMQMAIQIHLNAADGTPIECEVDNTINHVPGSTDPPTLTSP